MNTKPIATGARTFLSALARPNDWKRTGMSALLLLAFSLQPSALLRGGIFPGNAWVKINDTSGGLSLSTNANPQLTVQCWFKISYPSGVTPSEDMTILANRTTGTGWTNDPHAYHLWYDKTAHTVQFSSRSTTNFYKAPLIPNPNTRFILGRWYHVAVSRNGNTLKAYVDGLEVPNLPPFNVGNSRSTDGVSIGGWGNGKYLYGEVQEVSVYQRTLSQDQVTSWRFTPQPTDLPEQVGYFKLGASTNSSDHYTNFAVSVPSGAGAGTSQGPGQILFEETNAKGEQSLFDSMVDGGKNAVVPLSGAFAWQHSAFSRPVPGVPFDFTIAYSPGAGDGPLGPGWSHSFDMKVSSPNLTNINVINWQGGLETWDSANVLALTNWSTRHGEYRGELAQDGAGDVFWTNPQRQTYRFFSPSTSLVGGKLKEIRDPNGNSMAVQWHANQQHITNVVDSAGGNYRFDYNGTLLTNVSFGAWQLRFAYDANNRLASRTLTNTSGLYTGVSNTWRFYYSTNNGLLEKIVNPSGYTNLYVQYDDHGRRINTINALGDSTRMEYGAPGNRQIRTTDPGGCQWIDTYDRKGRVIVQRDPLGNETRYGYDEHGNRTAITDAKGDTTYLGYDERGNVIAQTNALGKVTTAIYHPFFNKPLTQTDPTGWTTTNTYDGAGNLLSRSDALGTLATYTYNAQGQVLTATDANGHTTTNAYNADGYIIAQTDAAGFTTHFEPNELGWNLKTINPLSEETTYAYDLNGKVVRTVDPLARIYLATYDACGDLTSRTDGKGQLTRYTYDALKRKTSEVDRAGGTNRVVYTSRGKPASSTDALGRVTTYQYDNANRQTAVVDPATNTTTTVYDAAGNAVAMIDPLGRRSTRTFDRLNRVVAESDPFGNTTQTFYDAAGRVSQTINANGGRTLNSYDGRGRLTNWVDAAGSTWRYAYDGAGNITSITDAKGGQYAMAYGPRNERTLERNQDEKEWRYYYDALLRLQTQTEPNGTERNLTYDAGGRLSFVTFNTGRANVFSYDDNDNPTDLSRAGSGPPTASQLDYDAMDRVQYYRDTFGKNIRYAYDVAGRLTNLTYPDGKTLTYAYDALDQLTNQVFQFGVQTFTTSYAYDQAGQLIRRTYPNGIVQTNTFDTCGRLTGLAHALLSPQPSTLNIALAYAYDPNGNTIRASEQGTSPWSLPALRNETNTYRPSGQLIDRQITLSNQLSTLTYHYDSSGNMTNAAGGGQDWTLTYDEDNRASSVCWKLGALCDKLVTNRYDAFGRRIARTVENIETRYVLDLAGGMERTLCEVTAAGAITAWYVHGLDLSFKVAPDGTLTCYHADAQGNIIALTGAGGTNLIEYAYTPYGRSLGSTNHSGNPALDTQPFLFVGSQGVMMEERDIPGLYFMRARYYSADAGVFLSTDPVRNIGPTWRPIAYAYANGNPCRYSDPEGKFFGANILAGAFAGAILNTVAYVAVQAISGEDITLSGVAGAALEGAITGAAIGSGSAWAAAAFGALGAGAGEALKLGLEGKNLLNEKAQIGLAMGVGGLTGGVGKGLEKGLNKALKTTLKEELAAAATKRWGKEVLGEGVDSLARRYVVKKALQPVAKYGSEFAADLAGNLAGNALQNYLQQFLPGDGPGPRPPESAPSVWHPSASPVSLGCDCGK